MTCSFGGFPTIRHNELRDIIAEQISEMFHNVAVEPLLQPLDGETFKAKLTATSQEPALMSEQLVFGREGRTRSSMYVYSIRTPLPIAR